VRARTASQLPDSSNEDPEFYEFVCIAGSTLDSLFRIICRIGEYPGVKSAFDAVATENYDTMFIRLQKLVVE
jgi:hypothetical protein